MTKSENSSYSLTVWNLIILILSVFLLSSLFFEAVVPLDLQTKTLLFYFCNAICIFFMVDFFYKLYTAKDRLSYLKWGWIDFVSAIPGLHFLWYGRLVQFFRILIAIRSLKVILTVLFENRGKGMLASVSLMGLAIIAFSTIAILGVENVPESNIKDSNDALWWTIATVTTVGYGDKYPVTHAGRIVGIFLMISGVALLGAFMAYFASIFIKTEMEEEGLDREILNEIKALRGRIDEIEKKLDK
jgi:voltage-gated potassium channel